MSIRATYPAHGFDVIRPSCPVGDLASAIAFEAFRLSGLAYGAIGPAPLFSFLRVEAFEVILEERGDLLTRWEEHVESFAPCRFSSGGERLLFFADYHREVMRLARLKFEEFIFDDLWRDPLFLAYLDQD